MSRVRHSCREKLGTSGVYPEGIQRRSLLVDPIPTSIQRFLHANIESVDQLEILRMLHSDAQREFLASELSKERQLSVEEIARHITILESRGLLTIVSPQPLVCRYGGRSTEVNGELELLIKTYIERPVSVIRMVYEHEKQLKHFAEAFRLKRE